MRFLTSIIILLVITTFPACLSTPEFDTMPERTSDGQDRIGFLIDGEPVYNQLVGDVEAYVVGDTVKFGGFVGGAWINISVLKTGPFRKHLMIDENDEANRALFTSCSNSYFGTGHSGNVCNIHFSRFDINIVSGTFSMEVLSNDQDYCPKVSITDGRFDVNISKQKFWF